MKTAFYDFTCAIFLLFVYATILLAHLSNLLVLQQNSQLDELRQFKDKNDFLGEIINYNVN